MKNILRILAAICALFTVYGVTQIAAAPNIPNMATTLVFAAAAFLLFKLTGKKKEKAPVKKAAPAAAPKPAAPSPKPTTAPTPKPSPAPAAPKPAAHPLHTVYDGKVVGVTFEGRQRILARLKRLDDNSDPIDYTLERDTYQGKPSIKVMAEAFTDDRGPQQIGFIAAADVEKVLPYVDTAEVSCEIYGGPAYEGDDRSYGVSITIQVQE